MKLSPISIITFATASRAFTPNAGIKFSSTQLNEKVTTEMHERFEKLGLSKPKPVRQRAIGVGPVNPEPEVAEEAKSEDKSPDIDNSFLAQCIAKLEMIESIDDFDSSIEASKAIAGKISKDFVLKADAVCGTGPKPVPHVAVALH